MNNKTFLAENSLYNDECFQLTQDIINKSIDEYNLQSFYPDCNKCNLNQNDLLLNNVNLHARDGFGNVNSCDVDLDTELRLGNIVHPKGKEQLCSRLFSGVPNLNRGGLIPNLESRLKSPEDTSAIRDCCRTTEIDYDRWIPLPSCMSTQIQNPDHIVMPKGITYTNTRDYMRDNDYLKHCGFIQSQGGSWVRPDHIGPKMLPQ